MTQEDKELLLRYLCAMLPYGVICNDNRHGSGRVTNIDITPDDIEKKNGKVVIYYFDFDEYGELKNCKPYLRPMSSMTEEESDELDSITFPLMEKDWEGNENPACIRCVDVPKYMDFILSHHFDYRGLIEKNLALEASDGMYNK